LGFPLVCLIGIYYSPTPELLGLATIALMIVLMFLKVPVAAALAIPGLVGIYALNGGRAIENIMSTVPWMSVASWSLSVLPMFVLMGLLLESSGLSRRLYETSRVWFGWMPGGLAVGTNTAGAGLAAVSGSTIAVTYTLARVGIPEMLRGGYDRRLAVGG